jgi:hypothetical protein
MAKAVAIVTLVAVVADVIGVTLVAVVTDG